MPMVTKKGSNYTLNNDNDYESNTVKKGHGQGSDPSLLNRDLLDVSNDDISVESPRNQSHKYLLF